MNLGPEFSATLPDGSTIVGQCVNCDARCCMDCVLRAYHDECVDDCPDCCNPEGRPSYNVYKFKLETS